MANRLPVALSPLFDAAKSDRENHFFATNYLHCLGLKVYDYLCLFVEVFLVADFAVRCSLENFSQFDFADSEDDNAIRHIDVFPLYAVAEMLK